MTESPETQVPESQIAVHWREEKGRAYRHGSWRCTATPAAAPRSGQPGPLGAGFTAQRPARVRGPWITSDDRYLHAEGAQPCPA